MKKKTFISHVESPSPYRDIFAAALAHKFNYVLQFLDKGENVNITTKGGCSLLHYCILNNTSLDHIRVLIARGAQLDQTDESGVTALHVAARAARHDVMEFLMTEHNADVNALDKNNYSPLMHALNKVTKDRRPRVVNDTKKSLDFLMQKGATIPAIEEHQLFFKEIAEQYKWNDILNQLSGSPALSARHEDLPGKETNGSNLRAPIPPKKQVYFADQYTKGGKQELSNNNSSSFTPSL